MRLFVGHLRLLTLLLIIPALSFVACGAGEKTSAGKPDIAETKTQTAIPAFDADSAYSYIERQVDFGPRVPNTEAHRRAGSWLSAELKRHGAEVIEQTPVLTAFDGTRLQARNILGRFNPGEPRRLLLLAHWDCRPWSDMDPAADKRLLPVDGANDGASGVGVLLEAARQMDSLNPGIGIDILFVDAEDWGDEGNEDSWALGTGYFVSNPPVDGYRPEAAILLDMVGAENAIFPLEYFSQRNAPGLADRFWSAAGRAGHGALFPSTTGSAVTDDHLELIKAGIPAIDVIDYRDETGFFPQWHTTEDNMTVISKETLKAVGETLMLFIKEYK